MSEFNKEGGAFAHSELGLESSRSLIEGDNQEIRKLLKYVIGVGATETLVRMDSEELLGLLDQVRRKVFQRKTSEDSIGVKQQTGIKIEEAEQGQIEEEAA